MVSKKKQNYNKLHLGLLIGGIASCTLIGGVGLGFGIYNFVQSSKKQYRVGDSFTINKANAKYMYNYADNKLATYKKALKIISEESTNYEYLPSNLINEDDLNYQLGNNFGEKFIYWELMASLADGIRHGLVANDFSDWQIYKMHSISIEFLSDNWCMQMSEGYAYAFLNNYHVKIDCDTIDNSGSVMKNQHLEEIYASDEWDRPDNHPLEWSYDSWIDRFIVNVGIVSTTITLTSQIARGYQHIDYSSLEPCFNGDTVFIMSPKAGEYYEQYARNKLQELFPPSGDLTTDDAEEILATLGGGLIYYDLLAWLANNVIDKSIPYAGAYLGLWDDESDYYLYMGFRYLDATSDIVYYNYDDYYTFSYVWDVSKSHWYLRVGYGASFRSTFLANAGYSPS